MIEKMVSIITPISENDLVYLEHYLNSLNNQMYKDFEIILIGKRDFNIAETINKYDDLDITYVGSSNPISVGKLRNVGMRFAKGRYVYFMDIDDSIPEYTLKLLVEDITNNESDFVIGEIKESTTRPLEDDNYKNLVEREDSNNADKTINIEDYRYRCLNILFKLDFIKKHGISFDDSLTVSSDFEFMFKAYNLSKSIICNKNALYYKIRRSDRVRYPSLTDRNKDLALLETPKPYASILKKAENDSPIKLDLDKRAVREYNRNMRKIYKVEDKELRENILTEWANALGYVDLKKSVKGNKLLVDLRTEDIERVREFDFKGAKKTARVIIRVGGIKRIVKSTKSQKVRRVYKAFSRRTKVKENVVLYESFLGKNMSDSPKYIYEYLSKTYPGKYKHVWVFKEKRKDLPKDIVQVKRFGLRHLYYLSVAKFWVNNMRQPKWCLKKNDQVLLECWHGTPLKRLVFDMDEVHSASKDYKQDFYEQSRSWDYLISANEYSTNIFKSAFLYDKEILELGYPRNDLLYAPNKEEISTNLKKKLNIPLDKKIVLYCPTWRDDEYYDKGKYKFKLSLDLQKIKEQLGDEYFFILRTHYFIADNLELTGVEDFVYNASNYDDVTELYLMSDVLITDYSSVFFDYANLKRPMLFFTYDLDKYASKLRGFYLDMETECPGPLVKDTEGIIKYLSDYDKFYDEYKDRLDAFHKRFCYLEDGEAAKRIAERVIVNHKKEK